MGAWSVICQFFCLHSHTGSPGENLQIEDFDMTSLPEEQSARPLGGAKDEGVTFQQEDTEADDDVSLQYIYDEIIRLSRGVEPR